MFGYVLFYYALILLRLEVLVVARDTSPTARDISPTAQAIHSLAFLPCAPSNRRIGKNCGRGPSPSSFDFGPIRVASVCRAKDDATTTENIVSSKSRQPPISNHQSLFPACAIAMSIAVATILPFSPAFAAQGDIERGYTLFLNNCAACHRGGQNVMKPAKTLLEADLVKNLGSADQATLAKFFSNSFNHKLLNFPSVPGGKLTEADVVDVTTYISDQALGNKW